MRGGGVTGKALGVQRGPRTFSAWLNSTSGITAGGKGWVGRLAVGETLVQGQGNTPCNCPPHPLSAAAARHDKHSLMLASRTRPPRMFW